MKYELTTNFIEYKDRKVYQIKALKNFGYVKAGDLGGYIENESNLSQEGNCWAFEGTQVYDEAKVSENAEVRGFARIYGYAEVSGYAEVYDNAQVYDEAKVSGYAKICGYAQIGNNCIIN